MDESYTMQLYLVGFNNSMLDSPKEVRGELKFIDDFAYFFNKDEFEDIGDYVYFIRFFRSDDVEKKEVIKEEYFRISVKFENINVPSIEKITAIEIFGEKAGPESQVILYYLNEHNSPSELIRTKSDPSGKFVIKLNQIGFKITKDTQKLYIKSIDVHGNESSPLEVN